MLSDFLVANATEILDRSKVLIQHSERRISDNEAASTLPAYLDEIIVTLRLPQPSPGISTTPDAAALHGKQRLDLGFTVSQLVQDYGSICRSIMDVASERGQDISTAEYRTLNGCQDDATSEAVSAFEARRDSERDQVARSLMAEHLGFVGHELLNALATAILAYQAIRRGEADAQGRVGALVEQSLVRLHKIIDRSLTDAGAIGSALPRIQTVELGEVIEEIAAAAAVLANSRQVRLEIEVENRMIRADPQLLGSAVGNLVTNAVKYTRPGTVVRVQSRSDSRGTMIIDVEDECGGLPEDPETLFAPYVRASADQPGLGLGLAIARQALKTLGGTIEAREVPGRGCIFRIALPQR